MSNDLVICSNGHVFDVSSIKADPIQRAAISWCPKVTDGIECGGLCVWRNPVKLPLTEKR